MPQTIFGDDGGTTYESFCFYICEYPVVVFSTHCCRPGVKRFPFLSSNTIKLLGDPVCCILKYTYHKGSQVNNPDFWLFINSERTV